jgi:hypothetical protein
LLICFLLASFGVVVGVVLLGMVTKGLNLNLPFGYFCDAYPLPLICAWAVTQQILGSK